MPRRIKFALALPLAAALAVGACFGLYTAGYQHGYTQVAYADPADAPLPPSQTLGDAVDELARDVGAIADADQPAAAPAPPAPPPAVDVPDPIEQPSKAWQFLRELWRLGFWPALAGLVLLVSRAIVARLKPPEGGGLLMYSGWRGKLLAIASALVAVFGPLFEVLIGTGPVGAIVTGIFAAGALLVDAFDPPKGAKRLGPLAPGELFAPVADGPLPASPTPPIRVD